MNLNKLLVIVLLCLFRALPTFAQPANASLQLIPPHSPLLSHFTEPTSQSLQFNLQMFDQPGNTLDVRLHMTISGAGLTLTTNANWVPPVITLTNGIPSIFSGYDLLEYFDPYHLDFSGMSREDFISGGGVLPEGFYEVCIQAMQFPPGQNIAASNNACATALLEYYDPPEVTQPIGLQTVINPQVLNFNWMAMHPAGSFITEYDLQVWEKIPDMGIQQIIDFTAPFFQTTTTNITTFPYGMIQPDLIEGHEYITRVRARAQNGSAVFKNDGYSQIVEWSWGEPECFQPKNANIELVGTDAIKVTWMMPLGNPVSNYTIRYHSIEEDPDQWTEIVVQAPTEEYLITGLDSDDAYEVEIKSTCTPGESDWLNLGVLVMGDGSSYVCGLETTPPNLDPSQLLTTLLPEDKVYAGDFSVIVSSANGQDGKFWGSGYLYVPFLNKARVNVVFNGISVNNGYRMVNGYMSVTGAGISLISGEMAEIISQILETLETIDDLLAAAEQIIGTIDDLIAEIEPYLPDNIIQDLINAQQQLEDIQQMIENGASGPEVQAALAEAQQNLENANAAYKQALEEFITEFIDILKATFIELHDDHVAVVDSLEGTFNSAYSEYGSYMDAAYTDLTEGSTETGDPVDVMSVEVISTEQNLDTVALANPGIAEYINKSRDYLLNARAYRTSQAIANLKTELTKRKDIDAFVKVMKAEDLNLLREIGEKIKANVEQEEIITQVKGKIVDTMETVMVKVSNEDPN